MKRKNNKITIPTNLNEINVEVGSKILNILETCNYDKEKAHPNMKKAVFYLMTNYNKTDNLNPKMYDVIFDKAISMFSKNNLNNIPQQFKYLNLNNTLFRLMDNFNDMNVDTFCNLDSICCSEKYDLANSAILSSELLVKVIPKYPRLNIMRKKTHLNANIKEKEVYELTEKEKDFIKLNLSFLDSLVINNVYKTFRDQIVQTYPIIFKDPKIERMNKMMEHDKKITKKHGFEEPQQNKPKDDKMALLRKPYGFYSFVYESTTDHINYQSVIKSNIHDYLKYTQYHLTIKKNKICQK